MAEVPTKNETPKWLKHDEVGHEKHDNYESQSWGQVKISWENWKMSDFCQRIETPKWSIPMKWTMKIITVLNPNPGDKQKSPKETGK